MRFEPQNLDFTLSPYTGLTRQHWIDAGLYLLKGIFRNIKNFQDPVVMPRQDTVITYPHLDHSPEAQDIERRAEIFEGLTRSFFIAAPLIHENPKLVVEHYPIRDYYRNQVLRCCTRGDVNYVGNYEDLLEYGDSDDPNRCFQQTVETCALVICLWECKGEIWDTYTKEERGRIAAFLTSFAHASTVPQNWRLFNMLDMAFLNMEGYPIDREIMLDHAQAILNYYVGDGWYRDGHSFDYYSVWAFNVYAPLWNLWYGYENEPGLAARFEEHSNRLMDTYPDFFDCDGFTNMWGRSNIYRNAATSAFDGNLFLQHSTVDPGLARRISSGSLLQFLTRDDFLYEGVPTLGFYGQFSPLVQGYSCAESPFWLGKAFLCLHLPADHPFWTAKEKNGTWDFMSPNEVKETVLNGPALCFTNHQSNGSTILRTGKVVKNVGDLHSMWNYSKLSFHSKYPWEATPKIDAVIRVHQNPAESQLVQAESQQVPAESQLVPVEAQQYVLKDLYYGNISRANVTLWNGSREGVLYRRQFFDYKLEVENHWLQALNLADFPVPNGILRVDKMRFFRSNVALTLGSYGFPDNGTEVVRKEENGAHAIILKGSNHIGQKCQMAMTIYDGWDELSYGKSNGTNPDSENSIVIYATTQRHKQYGSSEPYLLISQVITRQNHEDFTTEELFPIQKIAYSDSSKTGAYGNTILTMKDGSTRTINFEKIEGNLTL